MRRLHYRLRLIIRLRPSSIFLSDFSAADIVRTFRLALSDAAQFVEEFYLLLVVTDLHIVVVDDDRTFQDRGILDDEITQFVQGHLFDVDLVFLNDLGTFGDDVISPVLRSGDQIADLFFIEQRIENILLYKAKMIVFQIIFHFSA